MAEYNWYVLLDDLGQLHEERYVEQVNSHVRSYYMNYFAL